MGEPRWDHCILKMQGAPELHWRVLCGDTPRLITPFLRALGEKSQSNRASLVSPEAQ